MQKTNWIRILLQKSGERATTKNSNRANSNLPVSGRLIRFLSQPSWIFVSDDVDTVDVEEDAGEDIVETAEDAEEVEDGGEDIAETVEEAEEDDDDEEEEEEEDDDGE